MCYLSGNEVSRAECDISYVPVPELCGGGGDFQLSALAIDASPNVDKTP